MLQQWDELTPSAPCPAIDVSTAPVTEFFAPHARGRSAIFHMAFGRPARRSDPS